LDGKHVVFGEVIRGKSVVRRIENHPTSSGDVPTAPCTIADCGQLKPSDLSLSEVTTSADGDPYEDYPEDQDPLPEGSPQEKPEVSLQIAKTIREMGNKLFKEGKIDLALAKYQKSIRYLDLHPVLPDDAPPELDDSRKALLAPLLLNVSLAAIRAGGASNAQVALRSTTRALEKLELNNADKAKALYRRALARVTLKEDEQAESDLAQANELVPDDAAIITELDKVKTRRREKRNKEKKAFKKMFE